MSFSVQQRGVKQNRYMDYGEAVPSWDKTVDYTELLLSQTYQLQVVKD